jgi:hypothetical protein
VEVINPVPSAAERLNAAPGALQTNPNLADGIQVPLPALKAEVTANNRVVLEALPDALRGATGTSDTRLAMRMLGQASAGVEVTTTPEVATDALNATLAALNEIQPKDHIEGMLAVLMNKSYNLAMEYFASTTVNKNDDKNLNRALKTMAAFQRSVDTLKRYRGKDPQRIVVERFNMVNRGDAAITIGNPTENHNHSSGNKRVRKSVKTN